MKKLLFVATVAALALASCTNDNDVVGGNTTSPNSQPQQAIEFGTYLGRGVTTRAGEEYVASTIGAINDDAALKASSGFGVFAYYTNTDAYPTADDATKPTFTPNFMYNERVFWTTDATGNTVADADDTGAVWGYWPQKFWPNEFANGDVDDQTTNGAAQGSQPGGKISFFAYAPYTGDDDYSSHTDGTGAIDPNNTTGVTAISPKDHEGDPTVTYKLNYGTDGKAVDLLWGTAKSDQNYSVADGSAQNGAIVKYTDGGNPVMGKAPVNVNLTKQTLTEKVNFIFKHALAKVGGSLTKTEQESSATDKLQHGLQVMLDVDTKNGGINPTNTIVTVKNISIENDGKIGATDDGAGNYTRVQANLIPSTGTLNLATGIWTKTEVDTSDETTYTTVSHNITSPATDAGTTSNAIIADEIAEPKTVTAWENLPTEGVKVTPRNVYKTETDPLVFIPGTKPVLKITIEYVVRTKDAKLENGYTEVTQKITKIMTFNSEVKLNKRYNLVMHLGLTSVKFTATVDDWEGGNATGTTTGEGGSISVSDSDGSQQVWLPINVES